MGPGRTLAKANMKSALLLALFGYVAADTYMNNPRGSNNRFVRNRANDPNNRQTSNENRLFDSQDNNNGGHDWGAGPMTYYEGSQLSLEWTMQHGCGLDNGKTKCDIIWQYTCGQAVRDGASTNTVPANTQQSSDISFGLHESYLSYQQCSVRYRNMGLFTADQELNGDRATYTRQNPNGNNRYGLECPEERDYYPYWQWSPWVDIAILTTDTDRCQYYKTESQNVKPRGACVDQLNSQNMQAWMYIEAATCSSAGFSWVVDNTVNGAPTPVSYPQSKAWGTTAPACVAAPFTRDNNLGNARLSGPICCYAGTCQALPIAGGAQNRAECEASNGDFQDGNSGIDQPHYNWTLPLISEIASIFSAPSLGGAAAAANCVVRIRYNISTTDYDGWTTDSASNGPSYAPVVNDPWADYGWNYLLRLAIDTTQFGRTFQDRSHVFSIIARPTTIVTHTRSSAPVASGSPYTWTAATITPNWTLSTIWNLNVNGRRGNHHQAYPNEGYGFRPRILRVKQGDFIHPQWTGTFAAPVNSEGEGATSTDAHGIVQIQSLLHNWPIAPAEQSLFEPNTAWNLQFSGIYNADGSERSGSLVQPATRAYVCATRRDLELEHGMNNYEAIRHDPYNCAKLSGLAEPHFDGGLIQMNNVGVYYFMDPRNNKPGFQTVKGTIIVE